VDVDVNRQEIADVVSAVEITAACGLSFCLSSAADAAAIPLVDAAMAAETTAACGLSFCLSSAADAVTTLADAVTAVNKISVTISEQSHRKGGVFTPSFSLLSYILPYIDSSKQISFSLPLPASFPAYTPHQSHKPRFHQ